MISGIYKQTPPIRVPKETTLYYRHSSGKVTKETLVTSTESERKRVGRKTRKQKMASNKPKTIKVSKEVRTIARTFYPTWIEFTQTYRGDTAPIFIPNALKSDTQPLNRDSLEARMCGWIEQNMDDCRTKWEHILKLLKEGHRFMREGYGTLPPPTLYWLFDFSNRNQEFNINRVLNQAFEWKYTFRFE